MNNVVCIWDYANIEGFPDTDMQQNLHNNGMIVKNHKFR